MRTKPALIEHVAHRLSLSSVYEFIAQSYTFRHFNPPRGLTDQVTEGFLAWLRETPIPERLTWAVRMPHSDLQEGYDDGYLPRREGVEARPQGGVYDSKDLFHFRPYLPHALHERGVAIERWLRWLKDCEKLWGYGRAKILSFGLDLDRVLPGYSFRSAFGSDWADLHHVLRLGRYDPPRTARQELAKKHKDRDSVTIQMAQNKKGLYLFKGQREILYEPKKNEALFFAGNLLAQATSHEIEALTHGVFVPEDEDVPNDVERTMIVFFGHGFKPGTRKIA